MALPARRALLLILLMLIGLVASAMSALPSQGAIESSVRLSVSPAKPLVGKRVTLSAAVRPVTRGRTVRFEIKTSNGWVSKGTSKTDRTGAASVRLKFTEAGRQRVRVVALPHRRAARATDLVTLKVRKRPSTVVASWPPGTWQVGQQVVVDAAVTPATAGRSVSLERSTGQGWEPVSDPTVTDSGGRARLSWVPDAAGTSDYRLAVNGTPKLAPAASASVSRAVEGDSPLVLAAPEWVLSGELFEVVLEVTADDGGLIDAEVVVATPDHGGQVTPPSDVAVDPVTGTGEVTFGEVAAGTTERRRLRWQAPAATGVLRFSASLTAATVSGGKSEETVEVDVEVRTAGSGGGAFGDGLELTRESHWAPGHANQLSAFCDRVVDPVAVPTFQTARADAESYLAQAVVGEHAQEWESEPALQDPELIDQVVMVALADKRPAAALAAALRGHDLAPNDAVHLTNAAVAANELRHPEWAVAFTRQAALAGPAPSVGAPQEAIRLATQAHAWALLRDWGRAESAMREALIIDPDNPQLHMQLGIMLICQGDKPGALPHVRRGMRTDDGADPMETPEDLPETLRYTWLPNSELFDMSGGTEDTITTPTLPADWAELIARARLGTGYYQREYERLSARFTALSARRNELQRQLNEQWRDASPAWQRRTRDVFRRISYLVDPQVRAARETYRDYAEKVISLNSCAGVEFPGHPYCHPVAPPHDTSCDYDQRVFEEWLDRIRGWEVAMNDYHDAAWPVFTALQANLADPTAHAYAGVEIEMHMLSAGMLGLARNLAVTADQFRSYATDQSDPDHCLSPVESGQTEESGVSGPAPEFCSPDSVETAVSVTIDLGIMSFGFDCEKVSVETGLGAYGFLQAFGRVEQKWATSAVTYYVGVQADAPYVGSYESALFLETDPEGRVQDLGIESGVSVSAGYVVEVELYSKTARVSAMSYFATAI